MHHIVHVHTYIYGAYFVSARYLFTAVWTYRLYIVFSQFPGNLLEETLIGHALGCAPILLQAFLMIHSKTFCTSGISHTQTHIRHIQRCSKNTRIRLMYGAIKR